MGNMVAVAARLAIGSSQNNLLVALLIGLMMSAPFVHAQSDPPKQNVRTVSIPISIYTKAELDKGQTEELLQVDRLIVNENQKEQTILSIRSRTEVPLSLAILIQDDLAIDFNLHLKDLARFVETLPRDTRVFIGYMRSGSMEVRQKFTTDLVKASQGFRIVSGSAFAAPRSPYDSVSDALERFDALPSGRRAILMVSNGLDLSGGEASASPGQSTDLQAAIRKAQRRNVAVYAIYGNAVSGTGARLGVLNGQASLAAIADETGGRLFTTGSSTPIDFEPFLKQLNVLFGRQFLLTYLSENMKKGYYKVDVKSTNPEVKIEHPKGYYYR
jgi:VWFA-related protein